MCGIIGYVGGNQAAEIIFESLARLEYRGYDSAGIAVLNGDGVAIAKCKGRLAELRYHLPALPGATTGIGHTRWATHGVPSDVNSHPHSDCSGDVALVHNGIIENHRELRQHLVDRGHDIKSETDTELVAHLLEENYKGDLLQAMRETVPLLEGSMAIVALHRNEPGRIVAYRAKSPLILGLGEGENYVASDIPAILPYTDRALVVGDGEFACITRDSVSVYSAEGTPVTRTPVTIDFDPVQAEKAGFDHFMLKEIYEQPEALERVIGGRVRDGAVQLEQEEFGLDDAQAAAISRVYLVACGTAYHACLVGKAMIERYAGIPAEAVLASEFRYNEPLVDRRTLCVAVSQSGETADTLAAAREARARGACRLAAVVNAPLSTLAQEADDVLYQRAGPEIAVASTKAYTTQVVSLALLAIRLAVARGRLVGRQVEDLAGELVEELRGLPAKAKAVLETADKVKSVAEELAGHDDVFFIGRGADYLAVMEGQLKLKEISYIHAEAYAAGELKHGTLALIQPGIPVIAVTTDPAMAKKTGSNVMEVKARGGRIIAIGDRECLDALTLEDGDARLAIPSTHPLLSPVLSAIVMQLLAYYVAVAKGTDVDKPRNLAKSVTVE